MNDALTTPADTAGAGHPLLDGVLADNPQWRGLFGWPYPAAAPAAEIPAEIPAEVPAGQPAQDDGSETAGGDPAPQPGAVTDPISAPDARLDEAMASFAGAFAADPDGEGDRAQAPAAGETSVMPVTDALTESVPVITEGGGE